MYLSQTTLGKPLAHPQGESPFLKWARRHELLAISHPGTVKKKARCLL